MSAERDVVPPHRRGPRGRSVAARAGVRAGVRPIRTEPAADEVEPTEPTVADEVEPPEPTAADAAAERPGVELATPDGGAGETPDGEADETSADESDVDEVDADEDDVDESVADESAAETPADESDVDEVDADEDDVDESVADESAAEAPADESDVDEVDDSETSADGTVDPAPESPGPVDLDDHATDSPGTVDRAPESPGTVDPVVPPAKRPSRSRSAIVRRRLPSRVATLPTVAAESALSVRGLTKSFGPTVAVDSVDLDVTPGTFFGFVGPNGAGKTTTLSMITGLLRPDAGTVHLYGADVWANPAVAKRSLGVLPDRLRLFDRLTGREFLHHAGALRGLDRDTVAQRIEDLAGAFGIEHSLGRFVSDYSAGLVKKIGIAAALLHSPRLLVLDEPFESVDPVSAVSVIAILKKFAAAGGTVLLSSHSMDLIERECDSVGIIADGRMLAAGTMDEVCRGARLEDRFVELAGGHGAVAGMEWLQAYTE